MASLLATASQWLQCLHKYACLTTRMITMDEITDTSPKPEAKKESLLLNLAFNIAIPTLVLTKLSGDSYLGIKLAIVVALAFPIIYGIRDFFSRGKINFFSALGVVSVSMTGGISLMELDAIYIAIKEASIPALLAWLHWFR